MSQIDPTTQKTDSRAKVAITVNIGSLGNPEKTKSATRQLVQLAAEHHLPVTWAVDSADQLPWVAPIQKGSDKHCIALLVDDSWAGPEVSQSAFRDQLASRLEAFSRQPTAVLIRSTCNSRPWLEQLTQQGLTTVLVDSSDIRANKDRNQVTPRPMPWGLWKLSSNAYLPIRKRWFRFAPSVALQHGSCESASSGMHVIIHTQQLAEQGRGALQQIRRLLHKISWAKSARELNVVTAEDWVRAVTENSTVRPQRSILRIAA